MPASAAVSTSIPGREAAGECYGPGCPRRNRSGASRWYAGRRAALALALQRLDHAVVLGQRCVDLIRVAVVVRQRRVHLGQANVAVVVDDLLGRVAHLVPGNDAPDAQA